MSLKINGSTSGSVTLDAPATGSDVSLTLPTLGFGKVLQVVYGSTATQTQNNTNVYADTGLTATITPASTSSKILVLLAQNGCYKVGSNTGSSVNVQLLRGATQIFFGVGGYTGTTSEVSIGTIGADILDEPATTSATTYKTQFRNSQNATGVLVQHDSSRSTLVLIEVGP